MLPNLYRLMRTWSWPLPSSQSNMWRRSWLAGWANCRRNCTMSRNRYGHTHVTHVRVCVFFQISAVMPCMFKVVIWFTCSLLVKHISILFSLSLGGISSIFILCLPAGNEKWGDSESGGAEGADSGPPTAVLCWLPDPGLREGTDLQTVSTAEPAHGPTAARWKPGSCAAGDQSQSAQTSAGVFLRNRILFAGPFLCPQ